MAPDFSGARAYLPCGLMTQRYMDFNIEPTRPTEVMGDSSEFTGRWIVDPAVLHPAVIDGTLAQ